MNYQITLHTGEVFTLQGVDMDAAAFMQILNTSNSQFVFLGGAIVDKSIIASIMPIGEQPQDEGGSHDE